MKSRLLLKVFGTYILIVVLSLFIVTTLVSREVKQSSTMRIEEELMSYAQLMDITSKKGMADKVNRLAGISRSRVTLVDPTGAVIADSEHDASKMENHINRPEIQEARVKGKGSAIRFSQTLGVDMLYVAVPLGSVSKVGGYVRLARPLHDVKRYTEAVHSTFFIAIIIVLPLSLIIAFFFSYRLTSPIKTMEQFTEKLRKGDVSGTLMLKRSDEMKQLADNINYLVEELQDKIRLANEEKGKLIAAFASMTEGVLVLNPEDRIEIYNRAFHHMIASQYGDVVGKTLIEAFRNIELQKALDHFKKGSGPISQEITLGEVRSIILDVSISAIPASPGEEKMMIVFHDVTRLKRLEKMRVDFVANVTHEIKTPLTAILGFVETLQEGAIEEKETAKKFLGIISRHAERLNRLVEDLLTISDIEMGETKFFFESVSVPGIVENVLPLVRGGADRKHVAVTSEMPADLPPVRADRDRLVQILLNVLDNAVKFTPEAGRVLIAASADQEGFVTLRITDTGVGVPRDEIPRLGERFYRVDKTRSRELGGTGLGLSIVKHLMAAHNGRMEIESQLGKGTSVSLFFPIAGNDTPKS